MPPSILPFTLGAARCPCCKVSLMAQGEWNSEDDGSSAAMPSVESANSTPRRFPLDTAPQRAAAMDFVASAPQPALVDIRELRGCSFRAWARRYFPERDRQTGGFHFAHREDLEFRRVQSLIPADGTIVKHRRKLTVSRTSCALREISDAFDLGLESPDGLAVESLAGSYRPEFEEAYDLAECATLEAIAAGVRIIERPVFRAEFHVTPGGSVVLLSPDGSAKTIPSMDDPEMATVAVDRIPRHITEPTSPEAPGSFRRTVLAQPDLLVRVDESPHPEDARYMPVVLTAHAVVEELVHDQLTAATLAPTPTSNSHPGARVRTPDPMLAANPLQAHQSYKASRQDTSRRRAGKAAATANAASANAASAKTAHAAKTSANTTKPSPTPDSRGQEISAIELAHLGAAAPSRRRVRKRRRQAENGGVLGVAWLVLQDLGVGAAHVGLIGDGSNEVVLWRGTTFTSELPRPLRRLFHRTPARVQACRICRFAADCRSIMVDRDDISLIVPKGLAREFAEQGVDTVDKIIATRRGDYSIRAYGLKHGWQMIRRPGIEDEAPRRAAALYANSTRTPLHAELRGAGLIPRADVEIDIDMECFNNAGCYLWGTWDGSEYIPFVHWGPLGTLGEAEAFAALWAWLTDRRAAALAAGQTFAAYCYGGSGENGWMRDISDRWGGVMTDSGRVPTLEEVDAFIRSDQWIDVFEYVGFALVPTDRTGLKAVAPFAGFHWTKEGMNGERSLVYYMRARGVEGETAEQQQEARAILLEYNRDDCLATAAVRQWLTDGVPGLPALPAEW